MVEIKVVPSSPPGPHPKVSVIVTTYDHERFISQALEGALQQRTSFPFEVVVGEDCSTDGTRAIVERYQRRHPDRLRLVLPGVNLGPNRMYLEVMRAARGDYFAILDGDDCWESTDKLQRQVDFLDDHSDVSACFHDMTVEADADTPPRPAMPGMARRRFTLGDLLGGNFVPTSSVVHRRIELADLPRWFTDFDWIDWLLLILCAQRGPVAHVEGLRAVRRVHPKGVWSSRDREEQIVEEVAVYEHLRTVLPPDAHACLDLGRQRCEVQLAVERSGLSFGARIAVVGPPPLLPWYFNGRHTWQLATGDAVGLAELQRVQRLSPPPAANPHWRLATLATNSETDCLYVVVPSPRQGAARLPELMAFLRRHDCLYADDDCEIYQLDLINVCERRVTAVELAVDGALRGHVDRPYGGAVTSGGIIEVIGWAMPHRGRVDEVRICYRDRVLQRTTLGVERPDLTAAFPEEPGAGTAGFRALVDLAEIPPDARIDVQARLEDGGREPLASVTTAPVTEGDPRG